MKLRDHPLMSRGLVRNWPPVWIQSARPKTFQGETKALNGEIGVLEYVYANSRVSNKCFMVIDYEQERYVGCLIFDDKSFCAQMTRLLRTYLGWPIAEVGNLDISHTL